ncbi:unnamed protein product [Macrosiphum euphorbiae]|uniref:Uncharacterized protein n=1 Tax=Macrosiphum euphorbiae TaxID=13131 RepID=A0AAV0WW25_9HEMI|nr:unnamed protein product [Macrosiphum euphorbiae]
MVVYYKSVISNPLFQFTRGSDRKSVLLSSPSHRESSPSLNSPHQLSPTINSTTTNQNSQRQFRKRSRTIPAYRSRSNKRSKISIGQRSVSPPIDTHGRSNLDIQQNPNDSSNNKIIIRNPYGTTEDKRELYSSYTDCSSSLSTDTTKAHVLEDGFDNLINDLKDSFNITRKIFNNYRSSIESQYNQITQQCEKLRINLNDS